jgi:hypothetical protein
LSLLLSLSLSLLLLFLRLKQDRIDDCNGRDDMCGRNESILTRSSAVLAILIREHSSRSI